MIAITAFLEGVVWTARDLSIFLLPTLNSFYSIVFCLISFLSMLDMFYSCKHPQSLPTFYSFLFHPFFWHLARGGVLRIDIPLMASFDAATSLFTCIYRSALLRRRQTSMYLSSLLFSPQYIVIFLLPGFRASTGYGPRSLKASEYHSHHPTQSLLGFSGPIKTKNNQKHISSPPFPAFLSFSASRASRAPPSPLGPRTSPARRPYSCRLFAAPSPFSPSYHVTFRLFAAVARRLKASTLARAKFRASLPSVRRPSSFFPAVPWSHCGPSDQWIPKSSNPCKVVRLSVRRLSVFVCPSSIFLSGCPPVILSFLSSFLCPSVIIFLSRCLSAGQ